MTNHQKKLLKNNRLCINSTIKGDTFFYVSEALLLKMGEGSPDLKIHISSTGGSSSAGLDIFDLFRFYSGKKIGIVHYLAASIASVILQSCDWRVATTHSRIWIHHAISSEKISLDTLRHPSKMKVIVDEMKVTQSMVDKIYLKRTGRNIEELRATCEKDEQMFAEDALAYGLIDQIIEKEEDIKFS